MQMFYKTFMKTSPARTLISFVPRIFMLLALFDHAETFAQTEDNPAGAAPQQLSATADPMSAMAQSTNWSVLRQASMVTQAPVIVSSQPLPQIVPGYGGASFRGAGFSVAFATDITAPEAAVDVQTTSGQHIKVSIFGLAYIDFASGRSVLLAQLKPSAGQMISPTRLLFQNCFDSGISADVEFDVSANSVEQLIVIRKRIPGPDAFSLPESARLVVISSFDAPTPNVIPQLIDLRSEKELLGVDIENTMQDAILQFGSSLRMATGKAWSMDGTAQPVPVAKNWQKFQGFTGQFLLESAPYLLLRPQLDTLPTASIVPRAKPQRVEDILMQKPVSIFGNRSTKPIEIAKVQPDETHGVVLDWVLVTSTILNINFGGGSKIGPAAIGYGTNDAWNQCATAYQTPYRMYNLVWSDGSNSGVSLEIDNAQGAWGFTNPDPMYANYLYAWNSGDINLFLTNIPAGTYDIYIYGHGPANNANGLCDLQVGSTDYGQKSTTIWGAGWNTTNWEGGQQYVVYRNVSVSASNTMFLDVRPGAAALAILNGMQIVPSGAISHAPPAMYRLIDVDFGGIPQEVGYAAVGVLTNDTWNWYNTNYSGLSSGSLAPLVWSDGTSTSAGLLLTNGASFSSLSAGDNMYNTYVYPSSSGHVGITFTNLSTGGVTADFYVYAHAGTSNDNAVISLTTAGTTYGPRGTAIWGTAWSTANWEEGEQYIVFRNIPISTNQAVYVDIAPGSAGYSRINGLQIAVPLDRDGNGLPDWWEMQYFGHTGVDPNADPDGDVLSNLQEYVLGINPNRAALGDTNGLINLQVYTPLK